MTPKGVSERASIVSKRKKFKCTNYFEKNNYSSNVRQ